MAHRLHRVGVQTNSGLATDGADLGQRLDGADLVVRQHHRHQYRIMVDGAPYRLRVNQSVGVHRQVGDAAAVTFQVTAGFQHRRVLDGTGDDVTAATGQRLADTVDGQVVRLTTAAGEDDVFAVRPDQTGDLLAPLAHQGIGLLAVGVDAGGVAVGLSEAGQHCRQYFGTHRRGSGIIKVNPCHLTPVPAPGVPG